MTLQIRKKLSATVAGAVLLLLNDVAGLELDPETVQNIVYLGVAYVLGQGLADFGKEKPTE